MGDSKVKNENMILDFTHVYRDEDIKDIDRFRYIDCSDIQETDMYCSKNAYEKIWGRIEPYGIQGIHYIDSGNYHYITKIITDHITEPFGLVMYDHHTDMQIPMVPEMMSCGDWAGQTLIQNKNLRQLVVVGPPESDIEQTLESYSGSQSGRLLTFSAEDLHGDLLENKLKLIRTDLPLYISTKMSSEQSTRRRTGVRGICQSMDLNACLVSFLAVRVKKKIQTLVVMMKDMTVV